MADPAKCHCCLLDLPDDNSDVSFKSMSTTFQVDSDRSITLLAAYIELNQLATDTMSLYKKCDLKICRECTIQLENAYTFRELCRNAEEWRTQPSPLEATMTEENPVERPEELFAAIKCPHCEKVSASLIEFKDHQLMHNKSFNLTSGWYRCTLCQKKYTAERYFHKHFRRIHMPRGKQKCPKCLKLYSAKYLPNHLNSAHSDLQRNVYKCELCRKVYKRQVTLNEHVSAFHQKKVFSCDSCPKTFKYKRSLTGHKKMNCQGKIAPEPQ